MCRSYCSHEVDDNCTILSAEKPKKLLHENTNVNNNVIKKEL